jgi:preprotein translocase SecE subunit
MSTTTTPNAIPPAKTPASNASPSALQENGLGWFKGIQLEWGKVTWSTKLQLLTNVVVVLLMTSAMTLFVWLVDTVFRWGIHLITPDKMGA